MSQDIEMTSPSQIMTEKERRKLEKKKRKRGNAEREAQDNTSNKKRSKNGANQVDTAQQPSTSTSPFFYVTSSLYIPLAPISQLYPLEGICAEHLSPLILTYYPPLRGVVLSYKNAKLSEDPTEGMTETQVLAKSIDEFAVSFVWVTADFLVFRPQKGARIEGWVNLQNESHIGLVCWNLFNASIERKRLPRDWKWVGPDLGSRGAKRLKQPTAGSSQPSMTNSQAHEEKDSAAVDEGHFEDQDSNTIEGSIVFQLKDIETSLSADKEKAFVTIEGTLLSPDAESKLTDLESLTSPNEQGGPRSLRRQAIDTNMSGAQPE